MYCRLSCVRRVAGWDKGGAEGGTRPYFGSKLPALSLIAHLLCCCPIHPSLSLALTLPFSFPASIQSVILLAYNFIFHTVVSSCHRRQLPTFSQWLSLCFSSPPPLSSLCCCNWMWQSVKLPHCLAAARVVRFVWLLAAILGIMPKR